MILRTMHIRYFLPLALILVFLPLAFAAGVRNALRRKPRLILVGEARDAETISAALEAALTGHPVYTTLHTNGVPEKYMP